jgi:hypothetical protein
VHRGRGGGGSTEAAPMTELLELAREIRGRRFNVKGRLDASDRELFDRLAQLVDALESTSTVVPIVTFATPAEDIARARFEGYRQALDDQNARSIEAVEKLLPALARILR